MTEKYKVWGCKVVVPADSELPPGADASPRGAVQDCIEGMGMRVIGSFTGWGGTLTESELHVIENETPDVYVVNGTEAFKDTIRQYFQETGNLPDMEKMVELTKLDSLNGKAELLNLRAAVADQLFNYPVKALQNGINSPERSSSHYALWSAFNQLAMNTFKRLDYPNVVTLAGEVNQLVYKNALKRWMQFHGVQNISN